jgi:phosphatidylserine/phosphatidylglycerophosphate/cardiolipin synthase-like enzyme
VAHANTAKVKVPNTGVKGKVADTTGAPIEGVTVAAYDVEVLFDDELLGSDVTSSTGDFEITYPASRYGLEGAPDIKIRVYDPVKRLLYESPVPEKDVSDPILTLSPPPLNQADVEGWLTTGGKGTPQFLSTGNSVTLLIDNQEAWGALTRSVQAISAGGSIRLLTHYFDIEQVITVFKDPYDTNARVAILEEYKGKEAKGTKLGEELLAANRAKSVPVWLVLNDFPLPSPFDTAGTAEDYLARQESKQPHKIKFTGFPVPQPSPMHAKIVIVDRPTPREGFIPASALIQEYFDGPDHLIDDPRRGEMGPANAIKVPIHDVSVVLEGPAVNHMDETIRLHWDAVKPAEAIPPLPAPPAPAPTAPTAVQIVRTLPTSRFSTIPNGETGILEAYQRAFREAEDFIYIETQYFVEPAIADSLAAAMERKSSLVLIMLINMKVDIPGYNKWQRSLIKELLTHLSSIGAGDRVGVFTLWTHSKTTSSSSVVHDRIIRNYVHSKTAIVDDKWATIGSANMEGTGLNRARHISWLPESFTATSRGSEANAVFFNDVAGLPASEIPDKLRRTLWAEHLGYASVNDPDLVNKPTEPEGWLKRWSDRSEAKLAALKLSPPAERPARVLRWGPEREPEPHLRALGVDTTKFTVETTVRDFDFAKGQWK